MILSPDIRRSAIISKASVLVMEYPQENIISFQKTSAQITAKKSYNLNAPRYTGVTFISKNGIRYIKQSSVGSSRRFLITNVPVKAPKASIVKRGISKLTIKSMFRYFKIFFSDRASFACLAAYFLRTRNNSRRSHSRPHILWN